MEARARAATVVSGVLVRSLGTPWPQCKRQRGRPRGSQRRRITGSLIEFIFILQVDPTSLTAGDTEEGRQVEQLMEQEEDIMDLPS